MLMGKQKAEETCTDQTSPEFPIDFWISGVDLFSQQFRQAFCCWKTIVYARRCGVTCLLKLVYLVHF